MNEITNPKKDRKSYQIISPIKLLPWILAAVFMAKPVRKKRKTHEIIIISWGNSKRKTFNNDSQSKEPKFKFIFLSIHRKNGRNEAFNNNYVSTDVNSTYSLITCKLTNHAVRAQCTVHLFVIQLHINTWYRKSFYKYLENPLRLFSLLIKYIFKEIESKTRGAAKRSLVHL